MEFFERNKPMERGEEFHTYNVTNSLRYKIVERQDAVMDCQHRTSYHIINGIGVTLNSIGCGMFKQLEEAGIRTSFYRKLSERESVHYMTIPAQFRILVWNGLREDGTEGESGQTLCDFLRIDADARVRKVEPEDLVRHRFIKSSDEVGEIQCIANKVNGILQPLYASCGFGLINFELRVGWLPSSTLVVIGGMTPDVADLKELKESCQPFDSISRTCRTMELAMRNKGLI